MKTKILTRSIFSLLLLFGALWWSGCGTIDDNGPCPEENWEYQIKYLDHKYDSLFPYNGTQKTLTYLYSNDTIIGDTLVFELYKTDTMEVTGNSWSGGGCCCDVYADELRHFYYVAQNKLIKKEMRVSWESREVVRIRVINANETFSDAPVTTAGFSMSTYLGKIYSNEMIKSQINGVTYFHITTDSNIYYSSTNPRCVGDSMFYTYSSRYGFIHFSNTCNNESYSLIKD